MKASAVMRHIAEAMDRYGDVEVRIYNTTYAGTEDVRDWEMATIKEIRVDGMEVEVWV